MPAGCCQPQSEVRPLPSDIFSPRGPAEWYPVRRETPLRLQRWGDELQVVKHSQESDRVLLASHGTVIMRSVERPLNRRPIPVGEMPRIGGQVLQRGEE